MIEIFTVPVELAVYLLGSYTYSRTYSLIDMIVQSWHNVSMGYGFAPGPDLQDQGKRYAV